MAQSSDLLLLSEQDLRERGRRAIENLELWLRRLIDEQLSAAYGPEYHSAVRDDGSRVFNSALAKSLLAKREKSLHRFHRLIDAAVIDDEIDVICNPKLYTDHFKGALIGAFPLGCEMARIMLTRLVEPRNALSHAQPVGVQSVERIVCYSNDVIGSIQSWYIVLNQDKLFNVPQVNRMFDSFGNVAYRAQFRKTVMHPNVVDLRTPHFRTLDVGEKFWVEVEIDAAFSVEDFDVKWVVGNLLGKTTLAHRLVVDLDSSNVNENFAVSCTVASKKDWHRHSGYDDAVKVHYTVVPPRT